MEVLHERDGPAYWHREHRISLSELRERLVGRARGRGIVVTVRADRRVRWGAVERILSICREPEVRGTYVEFVVRPVPRSAL